MKSKSSKTAADIAMTPSSSVSIKDPRRRQYRSCDRCRVGKRACNAEYDSVAEAINNKVACSNCRKKGKVCSFQHVLTILGGVPGAPSQDAIIKTQCAATNLQRANTIATANYLQLLQMFEQSIASSYPTIQYSASLPMPTLNRAAPYGREPLSILETLTELRKQPMPDLLPLSSKSASSSSSMDTIFSFDSAAAVAVIAAEDTTLVANRQSSSSATTSVASSSLDGDDDDCDAARKKAKLNHAAFDPVSLPPQAPHHVSALSYTDFVQSASTTAGGYDSAAGFPSFLLQPPPLQHRNHDDLYTDDDDDDLVSYRATMLPSLSAASVSTTG